MIVTMLIELDLSFEFGHPHGNCCFPLRFGGAVPLCRVQSEMRLSKLLLDVRYPPFKLQFCR